jgi:hypothetical protein
MTFQMKLILNENMPSTGRWPAPGRRTTAAAGQTEPVLS